MEILPVYPYLVTGCSAQSEFDSGPSSTTVPKTGMMEDIKSMTVVRKCPDMFISGAAYSACLIISYIRLAVWAIEPDVFSSTSVPCSYGLCDQLPTLICIPSS